MYKHFYYNKWHPISLGRLEEIPQHRRPRYELKLTPLTELDIYHVSRSRELSVRHLLWAPLSWARKTPPLRPDIHLCLKQKNKGNSLFVCSVCVRFRDPPRAWRVITPWVHCYKV